MKTHFDCSYIGRQEAGGCDEGIGLFTARGAPSRSCRLGRQNAQIGVFIPEAARKTAQFDKNVAASDDRMHRIAILHLRRQESYAGRRYGAAVRWKCREAMRRICINREFVVILGGIKHWNYETNQHGKGTGRDRPLQSGG